MSSKRDYFLQKGLHLQQQLSETTTATTSSTTTSIGGGSAKTAREVRYAAMRIGCQALAGVHHLCVVCSM